MAEQFGVDLDRVRAFLAAKEEHRRARIDARFARATRDAQAIIAEIATRVSPRRIYQWGSLHFKALLLRAGIRLGSARLPS